MKMLFSFPAAVIVWTLSACTEPTSPVGPSVAAELDLLAKQGRLLAEARCAACHAVGEKGVSRNPAAPLFRTLFSRYRANTRDEELITALQVAHAMPEFRINAQGTDALIMYLQYLQEIPSPPPR